MMLVISIFNVFTRVYISVCFCSCVCVCVCVCYVCVLCVCLCCVCGCVCMCVCMCMWSYINETYAMVLLLTFNNGKLTDNLYLALEHNVQF